MYRLLFAPASLTTDRLWTLELSPHNASAGALQVMVLDDNYVALDTVTASTTSDRIRETLCRRHHDAGLERRFWLQPVGAPHVSFDLTVVLLSHARLALDQPMWTLVGSLPVFLYAPLDPSSTQPVAVTVASHDSDLELPYQLQLSWNGCPDITLRDATHQVLSFSTQGRMVLLPSQLGSPRPDVLYVGMRPTPAYASKVNDTLKNVTVTFAYAQSFRHSPVAIVQWALSLAVLVVAIGVALVVSWFFLRIGINKVRGAAAAARAAAGGLLVDDDDDDDDEDDSKTDVERHEDRWTRGRAKVYLWMIAMGGLFYLLPSLQTASSEASGMLMTGDRDACFYNELCLFSLQTTGPYAVTWWAANRILSNVSYVVCGVLLFAWIMYCKRVMSDRTTFWRVFSLPHDYTLFYCLAVTILYEGFMSATYHVCPNRLIFTVDTAFMFVGSIFVSLEVYRKWFRVLPHPLLPFVLLSSLMLFNYFGTLLDLYDYDLGPATADYWQVVIWAVFFVIAWNTAIVVIAIRHRMRMSFWPLCIVTTLLVLLGLTPLMSCISPNFMDRATMLLGVAVGTALINIVAFVFGTLPRVDWPTRITRLAMMGVLTALAVPATLFFAASPTNKAVSPWQSRALNMPCEFYDDHDRWHFLSAASLGVTVLLLMHCGEEAKRELRSQNFSISGQRPSRPSFEDEPKPLESTPLL